METETFNNTVIEEQLETGWWDPRGNSGLSSLWVMPVSRGFDGKFCTFRCEGERGAIFNMSREVLEAYYCRRGGGGDQ